MDGKCNSWRERQQMVMLSKCFIHVTHINYTLSYPSLGIVFKSQAPANADQTCPCFNYSVSESHPRCPRLSYALDRRSSAF